MPDGKEKAVDLNPYKLLFGCSLFLYKHHTLNSVLTIEINSLMFPENLNVGCFKHSFLHGL